MERPSGSCAALRTDRAEQIAEADRGGMTSFRDILPPSGPGSLAGPFG